MILVTGGTGFIGSHLLLFLARKQKKVRAIYKNEQSIAKTKALFQLYSAESNALLQHIEWVEADITDIDALENVFNGISYIYHTAAIVSFDPKMHQNMHQVNVEGTNNILTLAIQYKVKKVIHLSSIAALGSYDNPITEKTHWNWKENNSEYAVTKFLSEMEVWRATQEGLNAVILNPSVVLGAGFWQEGTGSLFAKLDKGMKCYTPGATGFVDVWDVVKAMYDLMQSNISTDSFILNAYNLSYKEVLQSIAVKMKKKPPKCQLPKFFIEVLWRLDALKSFVFRAPRLLSKSMAKTLYNKHTYSSKKLQDAIDIKFIPFDASITNIVAQYFKSQSKK